jgi:hypothetical protein
VILEKKLEGLKVRKLEGSKVERVLWVKAQRVQEFFTSFHDLKIVAIMRICQAGYAMLDLQN